MSRIYTRAGDDGSTGLFLGGRVSKGGDLIDACGHVDEAVAVLGVARAACGDARLAGIVLGLQRDLFVVAADLATNPEHRDRLKPGVSLVTAAMVDAVEARIDELVTDRPLRPVFIVPGATAASAALDHARTIIRRAERSVVRVQATTEVSPWVVSYLNRVSDLAFVLARHAAGDQEELPSHD